MWVKNVHQTATATDKKKTSCSKKKVRTPENIYRVQSPLVECPIHSARPLLLYRYRQQNALYLEILNSYLQPSIRCHRRLSRTWFQQDVATCHCLKETLALLKKAFGHRILSRGTSFAWPRRSPDLTAPDFYGKVPQKLLL